MIAHVFGKVAEKFNNTLVIDVGGVGYEVSIPVGRDLLPPALNE